MNGFELAGRPMKVNNVTERHEFNSTGPSIDETDERAGIDLGATGRLQLMYKLAEGKWIYTYQIILSLKPDDSWMLQYSSG